MPWNVPRTLSLIGMHAHSHKHDRVLHHHAVPRTLTQIQTRTHMCAHMYYILVMGSVDSYCEAKFHDYHDY